MNVPRFNSATDEDARRMLLTCLDAPQWADRVLAGRPYDTVGEVEAAMVAASAAISDEELEQALARHPRIGERADLARRLEEGNRAYEDRFGRVFIVRAAGRSGTDILEHLQRRLDNSDELERAATIDQLTQIAVLRMKEALS